MVGHKNPQPQSVHVAGIGLDGTSDDNGMLLRTTNPPKDSVADTPRLPHHSTSAATETRPGGPWSVGSDDLEDENTRVKRRKVSVEPTPSPLQVAEIQHHNRSTWHDQLQDAAQAFVPQREEPEAGNSPCHSGQIKEEHVSRILQTPPRSTYSPQRSFDTSSITVEIDLPQTSTHQFLQTDGAMDDPPLKRTKSSSTPKKKTLRSDHGKLSFSPRKSPRRSPRSTKAQQNGESNGKMKPTKSSKKVEMKNGKLVSSLRVPLAYSAPESGARIDEILSGNPEKRNANVPTPQALTPSRKSAATKSTHPFFLSKAAGKAQQLLDLKNESSSGVVPSEDETSTKSSPKPAKPWKDIVFGSGKPARQIASSLPPIWPPISLQHIHPSSDLAVLLPVQAPSRGPRKSKQRASHLRSDEDVLQTFSLGLRADGYSTTIQVPDRQIMSGKKLSEMVDSMLETNGKRQLPANQLINLKRRIESVPSCFDKGMAAGPQIWSHEYAPTGWQDVLEERTKILHDWLNNLQVHQVKSGKMHRANPSTMKKQRRKRKSDEMDDFIADSEDDAQSIATGKNAILLVGPPGSGKTASVFAIAQQLGFEVFEIHPGMRRSARDIQDKVGDMTQNHLVQQSGTLSRESSVSIDEGAALGGIRAANQKTMTAFVNPPKGGKQQNLLATRDSTDPKPKAQKQSLILFEEVDILFDDDKGFWSHVQWLIRTTKRPVIFTCNDIDSVPVDDLDLFTVLHYRRPDPDIAVQHLAHIAAAEGHLLSKEALHNLYLTRGQDLRAAITELNFWCQMTVGSQQGGLDWMLPYDTKRKLDSDGSVKRIVSKNTYTGGLHLQPDQFEDTEDTIRFTQDSLGISPLDWVEDDDQSTTPATTAIQVLNDMLDITDTRSTLDLFDDAMAPILVGTMKTLCNSANATPPASREEVIRLYIKTLISPDLTRSMIPSSLDPLLDESRIGLPTAPGRKAPTLDNPSATSIITEVAPYIRNIVTHDKTLEQLRNELHIGSQTGSNKRQRKTRASRAAMEGGSKGTTRRDKWFPEELDWNAVLGTGNGWPMVRQNDAPADGEGVGLGFSSKEQTPTPTPTSSMATETEIEV